jgi:hypothetical protein
MREGEQAHGARSARERASVHSGAGSARERARRHTAPGVCERIEQAPRRWECVGEDERAHGATTKIPTECESKHGAGSAWERVSRHMAPPPRSRPSAKANTAPGVRGRG